MKTISTFFSAVAGTVAIVASISFAGCSGNSASVSSAEVDSLRNQIKTLTANDAVISSNLEKFDTLDFTVFSNQQWDRLKESHAADIKVYWPDGHMTEGIEKHIEDLKALFVFAPDTRIK